MSIDTPNPNMVDCEHDIILILHGRLSELERYGRIKKRQMDIYKMFVGLLSVQITGCDILHTGIKTLIENNKGKIEYFEFFIHSRVGFKS